MENPNNNSSDILKMRMRLKTVLLSYFLCAVVLGILILLMHYSSSFYASSYPYTNFTQLPRNATTFLLSMFNGYTEKVPLSGNLSAIMQNIKSVEQAANTNVNTTVEELALAFILLLFFSIFSAIFGGDEMWSNRLYLLPAIFLVSLMASQYLVFLVAFLKGGTISGISLFFMDSLAITIWFGVLDERLLIRSIKRIKSKSGPIALGSITKLTMNFLVAVLPLAIVSLTLLFLLNLGIISHNSSIAGTYHVHAFGVLEFLVLFGLLYVLTALVGRMLGDRARAPAKPPKAAIGARAT